MFTQIAVLFVIILFVAMVADLWINRVQHPEELDENE